MSIVAIIIIITVATLLIIVVCFLFLSQSKQKGNGKKPLSQKCFVKPCEAYFITSQQNKRYCRFHFRIQQYHLALITKNGGAQTKTLMYMNTNAQLFSDDATRTKIFNDLALMVKKPARTNDK